jgi:hypothetical protein
VVIRRRSQATSESWPSFCRTTELLKYGGAHPRHILSAWVGENRVVLGQASTEEKSNEIAAMPRLLELLDSPIARNPIPVPAHHGVDGNRNREPEPHSPQGRTFLAMSVHTNQPFNVLRVTSSTRQHRTTEGR